jgi:hypothetical protein
MQFQVDRAIQRLVCESNVAAQAATDPNVRFWPKADIPSCTAHVRFRGKADMAHGVDVRSCLQVQVERQ